MNKKFLLIILFIVLNVPLLFAQKAFRHQFVNSSSFTDLIIDFSITTNDKGYAIAGYYSSPLVPRSPCIIKTDSSGIVEWVQYYDDFDASPDRMVQAPDSGFYLGVTVYNDPMYNSTGYCIIKTDKYGNVTRNFDSGLPLWGASTIFVPSMECDQSNGNLLLRFYTFGSIYNNLILYDSSGTALFHKYTNSQFSGIGHFQFRYSGNTSTGVLVNYQNTLTYLTNAGVKVWQKSYFDSTNNTGLSIGGIKQIDDHIFIYNRGLIKLDSLGSPLFALKFDSLFVLDVTKLTNGNYLMTGSYWGNPANAGLIEVDSIGNFVSAYRDTSTNSISSNLDEYTKSHITIKQVWPNFYLEKFSLGVGCNLIPSTVIHQPIQVIDSLKFVPILNGNLGVASSTLNYVAYPGGVLLPNLCASTSYPEQNNVLGVFTLYPNPAHISFNISLPNYTKPTTAILTDISGRLVKHFQITSTTQTINISNLKDGLYFLKIDGVVEKIIIQ